VRAAAIAMLAVLLGCAPHPQTSASPTPDAEAPSEPPRFDATLEIDNRGLVDITIYVSHDGLKERLGRSVAAHRDSLFIPPRIVGLANSVRLVAETAGTRSGTQASLTTEVIALRPGLRLVWTIESELQRSHLGIY
jgi:hypothetical protein